jgi:hypothetical protein
MCLTCLMTLKMPPIRVDQNLVTTVSRPLFTKRKQRSFPVQLTFGIDRVIRRNASTNIRESEKSSVVHQTTPVSSDFLHYEQRREVSTADLDKSRDRRERVVILGSGTRLYNLSLPKH